MTFQSQSDSEATAVTGDTVDESMGSLAVSGVGANRISVPRSDANVPDEVGSAA